MQRLQRVLIAASALIALGLAACTSAPSAVPTTAAVVATTVAKPAAAPSTGASPSPSAAPAAAPKPADATLSITSPTNGQTLPAGTVQVSVQYQGPQLVPGANATKLDDYHLHYFLDENAAPYLGTLVPVPMGNPHILHSAALQVSFDNVAAGSHTVTVALSGSNHITVQPPLSAQVTFTVQ